MKKDVKLTLNRTLMEKAMEKMQKEFQKPKIKTTDLIMIIILLGLYKNVDVSKDDLIFRATSHPDERDPKNYIKKTIAIDEKLLEKINAIKNNCNKKIKTPFQGISYSDTINRLMAAYITTELHVYTDCITSLYTIVGSKNHVMQQATANAVKELQLDSSKMTLVDACCATGALFFGLHTYNWKKVILNDRNPLRTNFLNVLKKKPLELIEMILGNDLSFITAPNAKNQKLHEYKQQLDNYKEKRKNYQRVDCNIEIAYMMFIYQCIDGKYPEREDKIWDRVLRFLPAHMKLVNSDVIIPCWGIRSGTQFRSTGFSLRTIGSPLGSTWHRYFFGLA